MERKNREVTAELAAAAVGAAVGLMIVRTIEHARGRSGRARA